MKKIFLIGIFFLLFIDAFSQESDRKIYFLADTINVSKENQVLRVEAINGFEYWFTFYCRCAYPYKNYVRFSYIVKYGEKKPEIVSKKPDYPYISFKELMGLAGKDNLNIDHEYELYITEALPGNKYRTSRVKWSGYREPSVDGVIIKQ